MYGKLKKMMQGFLGRKIEPLERNMMRGMFIRKIKDFAEDARDQAENETMLERIMGEMKLPSSPEKERSKKISSKSLV